MESKTILDFLHFSHPTKEQAAVLKAMESFVDEKDPYDFLVLCGAAGTGKTSVTAALIGYLNSLDKPYKISAPTGRAARILGRKAKTTTSTIHSMIYSPKSDNETGRVTFKLKIGHNSKPTIYIIDEASMIPKDVDKEVGLFEVEKGLIFDLIGYIKKANVNNKIIFLGDHYQLPPIGELQSFALNKDFLEQTFNLKGSAYLLTEVKRQEDGSYILENATDIRKAIDEGKSSFPITGTKSPNIYAAADNYVKGTKKEGLENSVAIGVSHKANQFFNELVRQRIFGRAKKTLEVGDLLMVTQNWYRNGVQLYNGDHVELLMVDWNLQEQVAGLHFVPVKVRLLFAEKETIIEDYTLVDSLIAIGGKIESTKENELRRQRYTKNKIFRESNMPGDDRYVGALRLMYGHAITCNKAQGGEWMKVFINTMGIPSLKWQYTAVTRGINEIEKF
ncbi:MAG: AAA family ATPase [Bacteroidetes bacterium]|nr:AAA family ATPase [Bacteroidota bacterium]